MNKDMEQKKRYVAPSTVVVPVVSCGMLAQSPQGIEIERDKLVDYDKAALSNKNNFDLWE